MSPTQSARMLSLGATVAHVKAHFGKNKHSANDGTTIHISGKSKGKGKSNIGDGKDEAPRTSTDATAEHAEFIDAVPPAKTKSNKKVTFTTAPAEVHIYEHPSDYHYDFQLQQMVYMNLKRQYGRNMRCEGLCKKWRAEKLMAGRSEHKGIKVAGNLFM